MRLVSTICTATGNSVLKNRGSIICLPKPPPQWPVIQFVSFIFRQKLSGTQYAGIVKIFEIPSAAPRLDVLPT